MTAVPQLPWLAARRGWCRRERPGGTGEPIRIAGLDEVRHEPSNGGEAVEPVPKSSQATVTSPSVFWLITSCGCESLLRAEVATRIDGRHAAESQRFLVPGRMEGSPDDQLGPVRVEAGGVPRLAGNSAGAVSMLAQAM